MGFRMTFFKSGGGISRRQRRVANNRPPAQPAWSAGRTGDCSQLYALLFYAARCKHSALRAPCSQRFTPESGSNRPTLMHVSSKKFAVKANVESRVKRISLSTPTRCFRKPRANNEIKRRRSPPNSPATSPNVITSADQYGWNAAAADSAGRHCFRNETSV